MATEKGVVIGVGADTAWVRTTKSSECEGCTAKGSCMAVGEDMEVEALNLAGAEVGDRILIRIDTLPLLKATFMLYVFPILCMIGGAALGLRLSAPLGMNASGLSAVSGFLFFFVAVCIVKSTGNRMGGKKEYRPKITRVLR